MGNYKTIYRYGEAETIINKSRFIGYAKPVKTEEEATQFIEEIKKKHKDATHNVPVYLIGSDFMIQRYSDDGEPSGTAGVPVLTMLKNEGITDIAIVVTRYFGGIKLGTGGLVRAYTNSAKLALEAAQVVDMTAYKLLSLEMDYTFHGKFQNFFANNTNYIVKDTVFTDKVDVHVYVRPEEFEAFNKKVVEMTNDQVIMKELESKFLPVYEGEALAL